ncbi:NAD(P)-dependent oxidoreductase [Candidatus Bipolaricaulota bacterium]|nr:NAD(P)-dependent oxidoreductase [Candidatus Bipolaricaulota bacterium]
MPKKKVLVTGGYGKVGTAILENLADKPDYDFTCFDRSERPSYLNAEQFNTVSGDVTNIKAVRSAMESKDVAIHLAAYPAVSTPWSKVLNNNMIGTYNTLQAAAEQEVEKFIYASSNHVVGMYERDRAPDIYYPGSDFKLDHRAKIRPDSYYGVAKSFGESLGRYYSDTMGIKFYALRICSAREPKYDHPYGDAEKGLAEGKWSRGDDEYREQVARMKCMWFSRRDLAQMVGLCLRDEDVEYDIFYGVSNNDRRWHDIQHAREVLGYDPEDNAEEWEKPPEV